MRQRHDGGVEDAGQGAQRRFHLADFDAVAVYLDLLVIAPEVYQRGVPCRTRLVLRGAGQGGDAVAGAVPVGVGQGGRGVVRGAVGCEEAAGVMGRIEVAGEALGATHAQLALHET